MIREDVIARLVAQAASSPPDTLTLRALVEEASELGAMRALENLGLEDAKARGDIDDLRELLSVWRDAKRDVWKAVLQWIIHGGLLLLIFGIVLKLGVGEMLR